MFRTYVGAVLVCLTVASGAYAVCATNNSNFSASYRGPGGANDDLDDYGRIHVDANDVTCSLDALNRLTAKLQDSLASTQQPLAFRRWLDGYNVALIFAAAQRIGANGWGGRGLEEQLDRVEDRYLPAQDPGGACTNEGNNTCMDEYAGEAAAYAWIAANKFRRMDSSTSVTAMQNKAIAAIKSTMQAVCLHNPTRFATSDKITLCNGLASELASGASVTLSVNHGGQKIPYGFGLMTSISSAVLGLKASGRIFTLPSGATGSYQREIAIALFQEAQRHVDAGSNFTNDCLSPARTGGTTSTPLVYPIPADRPCGGYPGQNPYHPNMYALNQFYAKQFGSSAIPTIGTYRSDYFNANLFNTEFFDYGRRITYGVHGYEWVVTNPEWMPFDNHNPIGYLEQISSTGVAQGWACDKDTAVLKTNNQRIKVNLHDNVGGLYEGWANAASEAAVNNQCGGIGTAHRFWIQLPSSSKGRPITAYGLDFTWFGDSQLPCLQTPQCSW